MAKFFKKNKTPTELVKSTLSAISLLDEANEREHRRSVDKISGNLAQMKFILYGDAENEPKEDQINKLVTEFFATDLLVTLLEHMRQFEFEARKDVAQLYNHVLRRGKHNTATEYVKEHPEILLTLVNGCDDADIALNCGSILRECIRHPELCAMLLNSALFYRFFEYVQKASFDVASDAFATFKLMLTKHKSLASKFLEQKYEEVIPEYNSLIQSENYVTKRQSLKLLGEILLDRSNFNIMIRYINDPENLKIMMNLLRCKSKTIQYEAFHVFKVFVANPKKSAPVLEILLRNREGLIDFLTKFQSKDKDDEQFVEEKNILLNTLSKLH